jgi:general secretion pathway protein J
MNARRGFTLIEVLVALAIFAILSAISFRGLAAVLDARARIVEENRKWREVAMAFAMMDRDLAAAANRPGRSPDDLVIPPFFGNAPELSREPTQLAFSRMGDEGVPARRVAYRLNGSTLELLAYPSIDAAPRDVAAAFPLLTGVQAMNTRFLDINGNWQTRWPSLNNGAASSASVVGTAAPKKNPPLPRAVELSVTLASGEQIDRIFALP